MSKKNFRWLKLWNEAPDDPKFIAAADIAGSSPANAWYAWSKSLTYANENDPRGTITGLHPQVIASYCRIPVEEVKRIFQAFRELRMMIGDRIANWTKRQTEKLITKVRSANAERVARCRAKKVAAAAQGNFAFEASGKGPIPPPQQESLQALQALHPTISPGEEEEEDFNSEAIASEREPAIAEVVRINNHQKERKAARAHRRSRISADWRPDDQDRQHAATKGYDRGWVEREAERFRDHHLKTGSLFADWNAAWRTWVGRADDFTGRNCVERSRGGRSGPGSILAAISRIDAFRETA